MGPVKHIRVLGPDVTHCIVFRAKRMRASSKATA